MSKIIRVVGSPIVKVKCGTGQVAIKGELPNRKKDMVSVTMFEIEKAEIGEDTEAVPKGGAQVVVEYTTLKSIDAHIKVLLHAKKLLLANFAEREMSKAQERIEKFLRRG